MQIDHERSAASNKGIRPFLNAMCSTIMEAGAVLGAVLPQISSIQL